MSLPLEQSRVQQQLLPTISSPTQRPHTAQSSADAVDHPQVIALARQYPLPHASQSSHIPSVFRYGTAGFRYKADILEGVMVRVGMAAALLPTALGTQHAGVMVTASHNDESYNGVKFAAVDGGMIGAEDEELAVRVVNTGNPDQLLDLIRQIRAATKDYPIALHIGRDTRSHSRHFSELVVQGALAVNPRVTIVNHGVVTTPMLHHAVMHANWQDTLPAIIPPRLYVQGYLELLAHSYCALVRTCDEGIAAYEPPQLWVDCAGGVGYAALQAFRKHLAAIGGPGHDRWVAINPPADTGGRLNVACGSEHVQKSLQPPTVYDATAGACHSGGYCCSFDGDADRIVFYSREPFYLLDGDKMAALICRFLRQQLDTLGAPVSVGVVQTAYANGASTDYLRRLMGDESVAIAKTGVKYVHAAAHHFDIGVYFEANGHGTIVFGATFYDYVTTCQRPSSAAGRTALARLRMLPSLVNQAVGDALSDLLLIDAILFLQQMTMKEWHELYTDLPSRQLKVKVKDRSIIQVNENETRCLEPPQVQDALDEAMQSFGGRAFVRPSGTEDVVRVYAEAPTRQAADDLAKAAAAIVQRMCGGVGPNSSSKL